MERAILSHYVLLVSVLAEADYSYSKTKPQLF